MGSVSVDQWVPGTVAEVQERWFDAGHWPDWVDEVDEVLEVSGGWPAAGGRIRWRSGPTGRGEVTETVAEYTPDDYQVSDVADPTLTGRQTVTFTPAEDGVLVGLALDYRISKRSPLTPIMDFLFVRLAMRTSLAATLERFAGQLPAPGDST
jgi:hypothetical protein